MGRKWGDFFVSTQIISFVGVKQQMNRFAIFCECVSLFDLTAHYSTLFEAVRFIFH